MALNPLREAPRQASAGAANHPSPFQAVADTALAGFRTLRDDLESQVRRGDLTPRVARARAQEAAAALRQDLQQRSAGYSPTPTVFLERLTRAAEARQATRAGASLESLQRETNRLLRQTLVEQQLTTRAGEFEGRSFVRPVTGGAPAPTLNSLLAFHAQAEQAGDEAAREWARRQLEGMRPLVLDPQDQQRIDAATDRPDRVNPRTVTRIIETLRGADAEILEDFVARALDSRDAGACCAAFALAREAPEGLAARWVRLVLDGLKDFPDAALEQSRAWEAEARRTDAEAAQHWAESAAAAAESAARLPGLEAPPPAEIERRERLASLPATVPGEPIGLALNRRGLTPEEFAALQRSAEPSDQSV